MNTAGNGFQDDLFREVTPKKTKPGPGRRVLLALILAAAAGAALYLIFPADPPPRAIHMPRAQTAPADTASSRIRPAPTAAKPAAAPKAEPPAKPAPPPGEQARAIIAEYRANTGAAEPKRLMAAAEAFAAKAAHTDAYLLWFFAAREGYPPAARRLARLYDPAHHSPQGGLPERPDLVQAYKWYRQAARGGDAAAQRDLKNFRTRVMQQAASGDAEAKRLSLRWR